MPRRCMDLKYRYRKRPPIETPDGQSIVVTQMKFRGRCKNVATRKRIHVYRKKQVIEWFCRKCDQRRKRLDALVQEYDQE